MNDADLHVFVAAIREAEYALAGAESDLHGIFGWGHTPDQMSERNFRIDRAKRKILSARSAIETLQEFI